MFIKIQVCGHYRMKPVLDVVCNPSGQAIVERSNKDLKELLIEQKKDKEYPRDRLNNTLLTLNFFKVNETISTADKNFGF